MDELTSNKNGIPSFTRFNNVGLEARVDLVGRPCHKKPKEGEEEVEFHDSCYAETTQHNARNLPVGERERRLLIASIKQVEGEKWFIMRKCEDRSLLN